MTTTQLEQLTTALAGRYRVVREIIKELMEQVRQRWQAFDA